MRFSSPGALPTSGAFGIPLWWTKILLSSHGEIAALLANNMIELVPPSEMKSLLEITSSYPRKWWLRPILDLRVLNRAPLQSPIQDVEAETHFWMHPSSQLVCSDRHEGRVLSCLYPPSTQAVSLLSVRRATISVRGPPLRAVSVTSCLRQGHGGSPCSI